MTSKEKAELEEELEDMHEAYRILVMMYARKCEEAIKLNEEAIKLKQEAKNENT